MKLGVYNAILHNLPLEQALDTVADLGLDAGAEHGVVVDDHDGARTHGVPLGRWAELAVWSGRDSRTSVPSPGVLRTDASPP